MSMEPSRRAINGVDDSHYPLNDDRAGGALMRQILSTVAASTDSIQPGAGDCVREFAEKKYSIPGESRLRHVLLEVMEEGDLEDECPWAIGRPFPDTDWNARKRFCDVVERKLRELLAA